MTNDLLVLEAPSITSGFRFLNSLSNVKLIDAEPIGGGRFLVVAMGDAKWLGELASTSQNTNFEIIKDISQEVLDAIYSLASNKLAESLIIVEAATATALVSLAQTFVKSHGLRAVEIKIRKSGSGGGYAYFTGDRASCENAAAAGRAWLTQKMNDGAIEVLATPSDLTRSLFED